jgi:site-specific recombinase XerC
MVETADRLPDITEEQWGKVNELNRKMVKEFLEESTQLSEKTLIAYSSSLRIYFWWICENCDNISFLEIKSRDFLKYQNFLVRRGMSSSGVRAKRAAVSSFNGYIITYYEDKYQTFKNYITKKIAAPPQSDLHEKKPMNDEEWHLLLKTLEERGEWQKIAYLQFTYSAGCRRAESRQILKDVVNATLVTKEKTIKNDDGTEEIKYALFYKTSDVRCKGKGKAGEIRPLTFSVEAMQAIQKWLEVRGEDDCPYLFVCNYSGLHQVAEGTFNGWFKNDFSKIIQRRANPHALREKRATDMVLYEKKDIKAAQALLGHKNSTTTEIYVIRDGSEDMEDAFI